MKPWTGLFHGHERCTGVDWREVLTGMELELEWPMTGVDCGVEWTRSWTEVNTHGGKWLDGTAALECTVDWN